MKLISWNVNGIRAAQRKDFLDWLKTESPDIMCVQETKAHPEQLDEELVNPDGYKSFFSSAERKGYSGVCTYSKIEPNNFFTEIGVERFDKEGRASILEFDKFTLMNIYFPNGVRSKERLQFKMEYYDAFLDFARKHKEAGKNLVICGDFNTAHKEIDLARPNDNRKRSGFLPEECEWMDKFVDTGFIDSFRLFNDEPGHYTWWDLRTRARERDIGWRIDYFFVNENFRHSVKSASIMKDVMGSDHCPVVIEIDG